MILALVALSFAEPTAAPVACTGTEVSATTPPPLATGVPLDAVPAGLVRDGSCGGSVTATLSIPSTGAVVASVDQSVDSDRLVEVDPGGDLLPDTTYALTFEPGDGTPTEIGFTTGSGRAAGLDGPPSVVSAIVHIGADGTTQVQAEVDVAGSSDGESVVALSLRGRDEAIDFSLAGEERIQLAGFTFIEALAEDEVCLVAKQRDIAGAWTSSEPFCVAPELEPVKERGCGFDRASKPVPTEAAALGLLLFGLRRRRR